MEHYIFNKNLSFEQHSNFEIAMFGMGCFWGAEKKFWELPGVELTAVGYAGGMLKNPTYQAVCSGTTGHNEVVKIVFNQNVLTFDDILRVFWENHNPTQGNRQGNDIGSQYRSGAYFYSEKQKDSILNSMKSYEKQLSRHGFGKITTEVSNAPVFFIAEDYHQQYLAKNPGGYCGLGGTGINFTENALNC